MALGLSWTGAVHAEASVDALRVARAAIVARDTQGHPFAIVDKRGARVHVFDADGKLMASSPVLLGLAKGDDSVPGIGERPMAQILPKERTTPAGRFVSEPGRNLQGEDIVWIDYNAAVSMHRVRATKKEERRLQRLATPTVADNRISYGCINVPAAFYDRHIKPVLGSAKGVVYVLPEAGPLEGRFAFLDTATRSD
ncbi:MAG: L,D-transpeptidase [Variovorax sp.]|nr:MAG: L,D-transpeptidase [Variovorax sp.]